MLNVAAGGRNYTVFVKRVFNASTPSINHLIVIPGDGAGITQTSSTNTIEDEHVITGSG